MRIYLEVENFAKIKYAKVCINKYAVIVGPNNSGKSFLLQLIQGVKIKNLINDDVLEFLEYFYDGDKTFTFNVANAHYINSYLNIKLAHEKEQIIKNIFKKNIEIGDLRIHIELDKNEEYKIGIYHYTDDDLPESLQGLEKWENEDPDEFGYYEANSGKDVWLNSCIIIPRIGDALEYMKKLFSFSIREKRIYFPAARSGLLLTYRDFFSNKTDVTMGYYNPYGLKLPNLNDVGVTLPIYEFMRFLQTYQNIPIEKYKDEIEFFNRNLINGYIKYDERLGLQYYSEEVEEEIPMFLASAMVNDIAPIQMVLQSNQLFDGIVMDEIEASLHPMKQQEVVRFINRLYNKGMQFVISTHSDTVVSKINNLYKASSAGLDDGQLKNIGLEKSDIIANDDLFMYELILQDDGKSIVKDIVPTEKLGYQFDMFTESAMKLYQESILLREREHATTNKRLC